MPPSLLYLIHFNIMTFTLVGWADPDLKFHGFAHGRA